MLAGQLRFYLDDNLPIEIARQLMRAVYTADELKDRVEFL